MDALKAARHPGRSASKPRKTQIATTLGIKVDAPRTRVATAVFGTSVRSKPEQRNKLAAVAVFDLATGKLLDPHDLTSLVPGPAHLANDVAVDAQGNIYVTDSLAHAIYKIDAAGARSVLVQNEQFKGEGAFTMNGLDVHPDGYLLVAKKSDGFSVERRMDMSITPSLFGFRSNLFQSGLSLSICESFTERK